MASTQQKVDEVVAACERYGDRSIIVLSGVAGTSKSHVAWLAAERLTGHPKFVKEIQFHQGYTYEDFIEGMVPSTSGGFERKSGVFLAWNDQARKDAEAAAAERGTPNRYVLLIEELTRANITAVLGELMTYIEHRDRYFETPVYATRVQVHRNLHIIGTMNPRDRSALEVDEALIRRLRIIEFPPDVTQLREILAGDPPNPPDITDRLAQMFEVLQQKYPKEFTVLMPFGHALFKGVRNEVDLYHLWEHQIRHLLHRPLTPEHRLARDITELYPWKTPPAPTAPPAAG